MTESPESEAEHVAAYLRANPTFFNRYPELVRTLEIPHANGQATSLWERQISTLRDDYDKLKARFDEFLASARSNEALIKRIHALALSLIDAAGPQAIFGLLAQRLAEDFKAETVTALVFAAPGFVDSSDAPQFVGADSPRREAFADLLQQREAMCGRLTQSQCHALFGTENFSGSHVILSLAGRHWDGLIAVSSVDPTRFEATMGTEFLAYLRDVVVLVLEPWIAKPR